MAGRRTLAANVTFLAGGDHKVVSLRAGDDVPSEYAEYLTNPALFEDAHDAPEDTFSAPAPEDADAPDYSGLRKPELIALLDERGLDSTGTVAVLRDRLAADDESIRAD